MEARTEHGRTALVYRLETGNKHTESQRTAATSTSSRRGKEGRPCHAGSGGGVSAGQRVSKRARLVRGNYPPPWRRHRDQGGASDRRVRRRRRGRAGRRRRRHCYCSCRRYRRCRWLSMTPPIQHCRQRPQRGVSFAYRSIRGPPLAFLQQTGTRTTGVRDLLEATGPAAASGAGQI